MRFRHGSGNPYLQEDKSLWSGRVAGAAEVHLIPHVAWAAAMSGCVHVGAETGLRALARGWGPGVGSGLGKEGGQSQANFRL